MKLKANFYRLVVLAVFLTCGVFPAMAQESRKFKVLVVMSYEEDFPWCQEIKQGIDSVLSEKNELRYAYLNTRNNDLETGRIKANEIYALYQEFKPDGVIAADDNAQSLFVIPYLKDKVKTPIMFNGVNAEPQEYGYPTSHISGILERAHYFESIAFVQQFVPSVKTIGFIWGNNPTAKGFYQQITNEMNTYSAKAAPLRFVETLDEAISLVNELKTQCDALFIDALRGIKDKDGKSLDENFAIPILVKAFGKPVLTVNTYMMKYGALCAVVKTGYEQGKTSAEMLLKAMNGTLISQIPITRNHNGKRVINVTALKSLGIAPKSDVLIGAELVRTEE
ncbi:MAG: ABC transporter substrate-binding protein [Desulfobacteraceae bacterium]|nr:ABC transporter substrate-binding protein [Desulfobacteraceae bacterium]